MATNDENQASEIEHILTTVRLEAMFDLGGIGTPEQVSERALFILASREAAYVSVLRDGAPEAQVGVPDSFKRIDETLH